MAKPVKKAAKKPAARKLLKKKPSRPAKIVAKQKNVRKSISSKPAKAAGGSPGVDKERFTLHGSMLSGPTYTVALMLSLCRYPFSYIHINLREGQHKQPDYLVKNRYGQVPCLRDGQMFLCQSAAILEHLAESFHKFDSKIPLERQRIREWLFWQWDKLSLPILRLRARSRGFRQFGDEVRNMYLDEARQALSLLDHELAKSEWIVGKKPTIADIGIYAVVRYAGEAAIDLSPYPRIQDWKKRFEALPGFGTPEQILPMESRLI
jgi:glutathione S-transferase